MNAKRKFFFFLFFLCVLLLEFELILRRFGAKLVQVMGVVSHYPTSDDLSQGFGIG